jgi:hypothetical protein
MKCLAPNDPNNQWGDLCPNAIPSYLFAILFGATTIAHITQAILYKKWYSFVIIMGGLWQTAAFIFRSMSIHDQTKEIFYTVWFILILCAPLWINAYVYMVMGRMVYNFLPKGKTFGVPAHRFGLIFVCLDIVSFFVQIGGASMASGSNVSAKQMLLGIHVYMIGIAVQQIFIFLFLALTIRFQLGLREVTPTRDLTSAKRLLYVVYAVLGLITIRIIFRLIEYSNGLKSTIPSKEAYMYVFDSLPMFVALLLLNIMHPGRVMPGKESDLPSRKQRKQEKRYNKVASLEDGNSLMAANDNPYPVSMSNLEAGLINGGAYRGYDGSRDNSRAQSPNDPDRRIHTPPGRVSSPFVQPMGTYVDARD